MDIKQSEWLLNEAQTMRMLGFKNMYSFHNMREALGLRPLVGNNGMRRYSIGDIERVMARHFPSNNLAPESHSSAQQQ